MNYLVLATLWIVWCAVHSGMISLTVTRWLQRRLGNSYRFYRLFFNITAVVTFVPVVFFGYWIKGPELFRWDGFAVVPRMVLLALAALLVVAGMRHYDMLHLFGFRQIMTGASHAALTETGKLNNTGILGVSRHPWYLAVLILIWTVHPSLTLSGLLTNVILTVYLIVGTVLEERKLIVEYGDEYREYQKAVSMLVPLKWLKSRARRD